MTRPRDRLAVWECSTMFTHFDVPQRESGIPRLVQELFFAFLRALHTDSFAAVMIDLQQLFIRQLGTFGALQHCTACCMLRFLARMTPVKSKAISGALW